jgi:DNA modification methylase
MSSTLRCGDNLHNSFQDTPMADLVYADMIYESLDFNWIPIYWRCLKQNGIFIVQTDWHSVAEVKVFIQNMFPESTFVNWLIWKNEFGNFPKNKFRQCHDDILIFCKGKDYIWHPERIQIPKVTAKAKGLNPSGRTTKLATSVITDICLTTVSKERVNLNGKHIQWQKPLALVNRLLLPFTEEGSMVVDPFAGSGTVGVWCAQNNRSYYGIEKDEQIWMIAHERILDATSI